MRMWEREIFRGRLVQNAVAEYQKLLSVNVDEVKAEQLVLNHFMQLVAPGGLDEGRLWVALALKEWQLGRLTPSAKKKAQEWREALLQDVSSEAIDELLNALDAPMPKKKRIRPPAYISHCPWPVGSLLAYRIISSQHPHVTESLFYGKYVLLRIVKLRRNPVSKLAPDAGWGEQMLVGLYDWIGEEMPDPHITERLEFTSIIVREPDLHSSVFSLFPGIERIPHFEEATKKLTGPHIETCVCLDWRCSNGVAMEEVFTNLGCDPSFQNSVPSYFGTGDTECSLCHSSSFDAVLVNRFKQLISE